MPVRRSAGPAERQFLREHDLFPTAPKMEPATQWHDVRVASVFSTDGSVFLGQHDGDDALGDRGIGRIGRMMRHGRIEIIDLEKDCMAIGFE